MMMESTTERLIRGGKPPPFKSPYDSREELSCPAGGYLSPPETEVNSPFGRFQQPMDPKLIQVQYPSTPIGQPAHIQSPTHPLQQNRHNSAPQTPLNEFFVLPNGTMPNGISIAYQPVPTNLTPAYSLGRLPDHLSQSKFDLYDSRNAANATGGSLGVLPGGVGGGCRSQSMRRHDSIGPPDEDEKWYLCQLCLRFLLRTFTSSVKSVSYSDDGMPNAANDSSFKNFAEETTMHGIKYVVLPGARITIKRVLWTLVFSLFWVYFISVSVKKVQYYYTYQHITQLDEESQSLNFPAITICNLNPIRLSAFSSSDLFNAGQMYGILTEKMELKEDLFIGKGPKTDSLRKKTNFSDDDKNKAFNLEEFQMRAGHKIDEMLKACKWRDYTCGPADFSPILTEMGLCYQYNVNKTWDPEKQQYDFKRVYKGGAGNGLKMLLITQESDYLPPKIEDFDSSLETGFKIEVHDPDVPPLVHQLGIGLAPGLQAFVVLQKEQVNYLGTPWGKCKDPQAAGNTKNFSKYSDPACRIECETEHIVKECECRMPFMPILSSLPNSYKVCSPTKVLSCAQERLAKIEDGEACGPETCIKACGISRYKSSLSSVKFPSYLGAIKLAEEYNGTIVQMGTNASGKDAADSGAASEKYWKEIDRQIGKQALVVSIYFQSLSLQKIEQVQAYDFAAMLGDIGGLMGLFIGASAMTLFEFLFFFCDSLILRRKGGRACGDDEEKSDNGVSGVGYGGGPDTINHPGGLGMGVGVGVDAMKPLLMAPGAVDGSKFVFNVNHNESEYSAAMSRLLPQFSAHPLHSTFQQPPPPQMQQMNAPPSQQQQSMKGGYSPLLKRGNSMGGGGGNFTHPGNATPGGVGAGGGVIPIQTGDGGLGRDPSSYPASPIPPPANGIPQNAATLGGPPPPPAVVQGVNPSNLPHNILVSYPTGVPGSGGKIFLANSLPQERYC